MEFAPHLQAAPGDKKWEFQTGGSLYSCPAIWADGTVYVGGSDRKFYSLDGATGQPKWTFEISAGTTFSSAAIGADGTVFFGADDRKVYALNGTTGHRQWDFQTGGPVSCPALAPDGTVYAGASDGKLYALHRATGQERWEIQAGPGIYRSPAVGADGTVYVAVGDNINGSSANKLYAFEGATGQKKWEFSAAGGVISSPAVGADGAVYIGSWGNNRVYALDGTTGQKKWEYSPAEVMSSPAVGLDGTVYVGSDIGDNVCALDGATGQKRWAFRTGMGGVLGTPAIGADGTVYVGSGDHKVYALEGATGEKKWEFVSASVFYRSPAIGADGTVYIGSDDGKVYALASSSVGGLAPSSWPKFLGNARNTGLVATNVAPPSGPPVILREPLDLRVVEGSTATFAVQATGSWPLSHQWFFQGAARPQATNFSATLTNLQFTDTGDYFVTVSNRLGVITSRVARITVGFGLTVTNKGAGTVVLDPALGAYDSGSRVELRAVPNPGGQFIQWSGDVATNGNPLVLTVNGHLRIVAEFTPGPGDLLWTFRTGGGVCSSPALGLDGTLYIGSRDMKVYALKGANGQKKWQFTTAGAVESSPAIGADGTVYVGSEDGSLYALEGATGRKKWAFAAGIYAMLSPPSPAIAPDGTVYYGLTFLDGATGKVKGKFQAGWIGTSPAIGADGTVYCGLGAWNDSKICAFDGATGQPNWLFQIGMSRGQQISSPALGADGTVYVGSDDYRIYALDGATGRKKWEFATQFWVESSPVIGTDGTIYVGSGDGRIYALDGATGRKRWAFQTWWNLGTASPAVGADGAVYIGTGYGHELCALDGATGVQKWAFLTADVVISAPAIGTNGTIYFGSLDGKVYALASSSIGGLAPSPWPKFRGNARNTGCIPVPPRIVRGLDSGVLRAGQSTNLSVQVLGDPPLSVQWFFNGQPIPGATNCAYTIDSVSAAHAGTYALVATNTLGVTNSEPSVLGVNNVVASNYLGLVLYGATNVPVHLEFANSVRGPWLTLTNLTLSANPYTFVDLTARNTGQRFYRTELSPDTMPLERLEAWLFPGWTLNNPVGSTNLIEYVDSQVGFTNWQFLTHLTLPASPYLFIDKAATNKWTRYYRTTPLP